MNKNITRSMLLDSLIYGKEITLNFLCHEKKEWIPMTGIVRQLGVESGFSENQHLQHFLVILADKQGFRREIYVNTID